MILDINPEPLHQNVYEVKIHCSYHTDKPQFKVEQDVTLYVAPDSIEKTVLEIETVKNQFGPNREYENDIYNQRNFFLHNEEDFSWLRQIKTYQKTNYTVQAYEVAFYNSMGIKSSVEVKDLDVFLSQLSEINDKHQIASYFWTETAEDSDFENYFNDIKACINPYILSQKLDSNLAEKSIAHKKRKI